MWRAFTTDVSASGRKNRVALPGGVPASAIERAVERELEAQEESDRRVAASADAERVRSTQR
jgi:hypothetical protein